MGLGVWGQNRGRGGAILTPNELVLPFRGIFVCANFGENRSRNATVRVLADGRQAFLRDLTVLPAYPAYTGLYCALYVFFCILSRFLIAQIHHYIYRLLVSLLIYLLLQIEYPPGDSLGVIKACGRISQIHSQLAVECDVTEPWPSARTNTR